MAQRKNFENRKKQRTVEALERQAKSDKVPLEQKLAKATPGSREYTKLQARSQK